MDKIQRKFEQYKDGLRHQIKKETEAARRAEADGRWDDYWQHLNKGADLELTLKHSAGASFAFQELEKIANED